MTERHRKNHTKTLWRRPTMSATVNTTLSGGLLPLLTVAPGTALSTRLSPSSRTPAQRIWRRNATGERAGKSQQPYPTWPLTAAAAAAHVCPHRALQPPAFDVDSPLVHKIFVRSQRQAMRWICLQLFLTDSIMSTFHLLWFCLIAESSTTR